MKNALDKFILVIYKIIFREKPTPAVDNFLKSLSFVGMGFGISAVLGLATQILAGRILGPSEYGKYALIQAVASFLCLPMLMGISTALIKYGAEKDNFDDQKKIISTSYLLFLIFSAVFIAIFLIFSHTISYILNMSFELLVYSVIFSFFFSFYMISISIMQGLKKMKILSILQIIYGISGIVAFLLFIFFKFLSFRAILFSSLINYSIVFIAIIIIFRKYFCFNLDKNLAKKFLKYGLYTSIFSLAAVIYFNFDRIWINKLFGATQVGIYGSYYLAFITTSVYLFNTFNLVFFPMISGIKDKEVIYKKINKRIWRLSILFFLLILLMGTIIVKLYGHKYQFNFLLCLLFSGAAVVLLINALYVWCANSFGTEGAKTTSIAAIVTAIVNIVANIIFIPILGFFGAVISIILSYIVSIIIVISRKKYYKLIVSDK